MCLAHTFIAMVHLYTNCLYTVRIMSLARTMVTQYLSTMLMPPCSLAKSNAVQHLHTDIVEHDVDVALVAETWFTVKHCDQDIETDQYKLFRRDRIRRKGGGVCAYVRAHYRCQIFHPAPNHDLIEIMWLKIDVGNNLYFVACAYHPPKSKYPPVDFITELTNGIESVILSYPSSTIVIAGDFNQLDTSCLNIDYGLLQIVTTPTHNLNLIDKVFVNHPDKYEAYCIQSLIKTKHMAVLIVPVGAHCPDNLVKKHKRTTVSVYDLRSHNIDRLRYAIGTFDWSSVLLCYDVTTVYNTFCLLSVT